MNKSRRFLRMLRKNFKKKRTKTHNSAQKRTNALTPLITAIYPSNFVCKGFKGKTRIG